MIFTCNTHLAPWKWLGMTNWSICARDTNTSLSWPTEQASQLGQIPQERETGGRAQHHLNTAILQSKCLETVCRVGQN